MPKWFFEDVADALVGFLPPGLRDFESFRTGRNIKVWYGEASREHYEAQILTRSALAAAGRPERARALEIGFHAEHPHAARNDEALARIVGGRAAWRRALGPEAEPGEFIGRHAPVWRRLSELWPKADPLYEETAVEVAERLATYIRTLEPIRRRRATRGASSGGPRGARTRGPRTA